jgi:hypothetical protein
MSTLRSVRRRLPAIMLLCLPVSIAFCAQAQAGTYGELSRYVMGGNVTLTSETDALGVDQEDNSVFVGFHDGETGKYSIEKVKVSTGNKGEVLGTVKFKPPKEPNEVLSEQAEGIEGVAVDPVKERIYVLARYDQEDVFGSAYVAGALYAFSTKPKEGKLVPASGANEEGLLAGFSALKANASEPDGPLLSPQGITVDPTTHEVIILGEEEKGTSGHPARHLALQRVSEAGVAGKRYVSAETLAEEASVVEVANSPVVSESGKVYLQRTGSLVEVPANFESTTPPTSLFALSPFEGGTIEQKLLEFDIPSEGENLGASLTLAPRSSTEGTFYSTAEIYPYVVKEGQVAEGAGGPYPGALALDYSEHGEEVKVSEDGWTGGQAEKTCSVGFLGETYATLAAGREGKLFVLSNPEGEAAELIEFGPEGKGCPVAAAAPMRAEVGGKAVPTAGVGIPVKFVVELTANATSVEWNFGDGSAPQTVTTGEYQTATVKHTFAKGGTFKVKAKIHTDDLATEEVDGEMSIAATEPPKITKQPSSESVKEGESVVFEAEASGEPTPSVQWEVSSNRGASWAAVGAGTSGGTTDKLTVASASGAESGNEYRAKFTNSVSSATSAVGMLTVGDGEPVVTKNPSGLTVTEGSEAVFEAQATGTPTPTVQWEVSTDGGGSWSVVSGATSERLVVSSAKSTESGHEWRAKFTNPAKSVTSAAATLTVNAKSSGGGGGGGGTGGGGDGGGAGPTTTGTTTTTTTGGGQGVLPARAVAPAAVVAGTSLKVSPSGAVVIKVSCPAGATTCIGSVTLRTLTAVSAGAHAAKKSVLTLASGTFALAGGQSKTITLHLSSKARALLKRSHTLRARALIVAHDPAGEQHTGSALVTLALAKSKH